MSVPDLIVILKFKKSCQGLSKNNKTSNLLLIKENPVGIRKDALR